MYKTFAFMKRRDDMDLDAFRDYYESHHVPLVLSCAPAPPVYKRNYVERSSASWPGDDGPGFDVITEVGFPDEAGYLAWVKQLPVDLIDADEARFMHPTTRRPHRVCFVDERTR